MALPNPVKVAVIGAGHLGRHHARIYSELPDVELAAVVDLRKERADAAAAGNGARALTDYREVLGQVDAASVAVPTTDHARVAADLLESGSDVLVEKPMTATLDDARRLIDLARGKGRILQVGHVERFNPVVTEVQNLVTQPQFFEIHRLAAFSPRSLDIDVVLDLMIHDLDIVSNFVKSPVREIRAVGIAVLSDKTDIANVRIEFESGCVANLTASRVSFDKMRKLRFFQPHDYISVDYAEQSGTVVSLRNGRIMERKLDPAKQEPLRIQLEAFIDSVRTRKPPAVSGEDGWRVLSLAQEIKATIGRRLNPS